MKQLYGYGFPLCIMIGLYWRLFLLAFIPSHEVHFDSILFGWELYIG